MDPRKRPLPLQLVLIRTQRYLVTSMMLHIRDLRDFNLLIDTFLPLGFVLLDLYQMPIVFIFQYIDLF